MSREDAIRKGQAAAALLASADFNIAIDTVRIDAFKGWANSDPTQKEQRENHYFLIQAINQLKLNLEALVSNARVEEHNAKREEAEAAAKANNPEE